MRTIIRFNIQTDDREQPTVEAMRAYLSQPCEPFISELKDKIHLRDDWEATPYELRSMAKEKGVETMEDLLGGFGFTTFEVF
jgi:hypothetical protein